MKRTHVKANRFIIYILSAFLAAEVCFSCVTAVRAQDNLPYVTYNYNYWEDIVYTPAAYEPETVIKGGDLTYMGESLGEFVTPQDICVSEDGDIYLCDTGNNRIVIMNSSMSEVKKVITVFNNDGKEDTFNQPYGVAVALSGDIYVADSQNNRIVELDKDDNVVRIIDNPESEALEEGFVFVPLKVTVDYADRVYCVAQNMFEGIMVFETDNSFAGFFGTINVDITLWERFWRKIASKEERSKSRLFIPTEFTGIDVDPSGFVFASNIDPDGKQGVRRLNMKGQDVIVKGANDNLGGDLWTEGDTEYSGPSQFVDVVYRDAGIYSCLDKRRGRIFTYDHEGNLLYIFGGMGTQAGTFKMPASIEQVGNDILVLDNINANVTYFKETEYGRLINEAVSLRYEGDETRAVELWKQVLVLDENNELANTGIGKAYLTAGNYTEAMKYLRLGMAREYYSVAFRRYRNEFLTENADVIFTGIIIIIAAVLIYRKIHKQKITKNEVK